MFCVIDLPQHSPRATTGCSPHTVTHPRCSSSAVSGEVLPDHRCHQGH